LIERGCGSSSGTVWAGTLPGGLFRSGDGGESWQLNEPLWNQPGRAEWFGGGHDAPGIHSICPHPLRPEERLVGISCGGAWVTRDDGANRALQSKGMHSADMPPDQATNPNTQDPHSIQRCAAQPDVLCCQHHNGIWWSTDSAASWHEVTGVPVSNFGFPVAVHPEQPDTAWFVPGAADQQRVPVDGALVLNRTRDGGRSFDALHTGLPSEHCHDLVYRHGVVVDLSGHRLLMGSTTGGLWAQRQRRRPLVRRRGELAADLRGPVWLMKWVWPEFIRASLPCEFFIQSPVCGLCRTNNQQNVGTAPLRGMSCH